MIHFLHIGKTGGTALKHALENVKNTPFGGINFHTHKTRLCDIPEGEKVIFFVREPLSRFVSGFYSRQRKGLPRYCVEWTEDESTAFSNFKTPTEILNSAVSSIVCERQNAIHALQTICHVRDHYSYWLESVEYLQERLKDILYLGSLETIENDFENIKTLLHLSSDINLPSSEKDAHINPRYETPDFGKAQEAFFNGWYAFDFELYKFCTQNLKDKVNSN